MFQRIKRLAVATSLSFCLAPIALAQSVNPQIAQGIDSTSSESHATAATSAAPIAGQIESINRGARTVAVKTADGSIRTYHYQKGALNNLNVGSSVLVNPRRVMSGTVVDRFRDYMRIRLDDGSGRTIITQVIRAPYNPINVGDKVIVWNDGKVSSQSVSQLEMASGVVDGYLARGEIVGYTAIARKETTEVRQEARRVETPVQRPAVKAPVAVPSSPKTSEQPVRGLW